MVEMKVVDRQQEERLFQRLLDAPEGFDQETFEALVDRFRSRLSIDDVMALTARRLRDRQDADPIERKALLAILEGSPAEADRLLTLLERRNRAGLRVATRGRAFPPRSS